MNPLALALQGIGYGALLVAAQGFAPVTETATVQAPTYYSASIDAVQALRRQQLEEDEVMLAVIQKFVMEA